MKTAKQLEKYFKGVANHRRIEILYLLAKNKGAPLEDISKSLKGNIKTVSAHTRRLVQAALANKKYQGRVVGHFLSPFGKKFLKLMETFSHSSECWNVEFGKGKTKKSNK